MDKFCLIQIALRLDISPDFIPYEHKTASLPQAQAHTKANIIPTILLVVCPSSTKPKARKVQRKQAKK